MSAKISTGLLLLILACLIYCYGHQITVSARCYYCSDYAKFYQSAQFASAGKSIYAKIYVATPQGKKEATPTLNPPFFGLLLLPFNKLSYKISLWLWSILAITAGIISIFLLHRSRYCHSRARGNPGPLPDGRGSDFKLLLILLTAFFAYFPTFATIQYGQVSLFLLLITTGAWLSARQGKITGAGILLGIAASLKLFFGLFFIYFLLRREWRALIGFIITILICALLPLLLWPPEIYLDYQQTLSHIHWYASSWNVSLYGFLVRLLGGEINVPIIAYSAIVQPIFLLLSGLTLLALILFLRPDKKINPSLKLDLDFSITLIIMLFLAPLSWLYYFPLLLIPILVLFAFSKNQSDLCLLLPICASIILSGLPHILVPSSHITSVNANAVFMLSVCPVLTLLILSGEFFYIRYYLPVLKKSRHFDNHSLLLFYLTALAPSFLTILWLVFR